MTRKDYNLIAKALHATRPDAFAGATYKVWFETVESVGVALRDTNPRFDFDRFVEACDAGE